MERVLVAGSINIDIVTLVPEFLIRFVLWMMTHTFFKVRIVVSRRSRPLGGVTATLAVSAPAACASRCADGEPSWETASSTRSLFSSPAIASDVRDSACIASTSAADSDTP